jgi:hypothetical protein
LVFGWLKIQVFGKLERIVKQFSQNQLKPFLQISIIFDTKQAQS